MSAYQYASESSLYFSNVRMEAVGILPVDLDQVFEVGCGAGSSLERLKQERNCRWFGDVEIDSTASAVAREIAHSLYIFKI